MTTRSTSRFAKVRDDWQTYRYLHEAIQRDHGENYPPPWRHLRSYFCTLTNGCAWGPVYERENSLMGPARFCWKCRSSWGNPLDTQDDRPWRRLHPALRWVEALERHRFERSLDRIRERHAR